MHSPKSRAGKRIGMWLVVVGVLVGLISLWSRPDSERGDPPQDHASVPGEGPDRNSSPDLRVAAELGTPAAASNRSTAGSDGSMVRGIVTDAAFGIPVVAVIRRHSGVQRVSDPTTGLFELRMPAGAASSMITVTASNYLPQHVQVEPAALTELLRVQLVPAQRIHVVATYDDGTAAMGCGVSLHAAAPGPATGQIRDWIGAARPDRSSVVEGLTDSSGTFSSSIGVTSIVSLKHPNSRSARSVFRAEPGETVHVQLPHRPSLLRVRDRTTQAPVPALDLELWCPTEPMAVAQSLTTNELGEAEFSNSTFPVLVRLRGSRVWQSRLTPLSPGMTRVSLGGDAPALIKTMVRIDAPSPSSAYDLEVGGCGLRLELTDANTGSRVSALVRVRRRNPEMCPAVAEQMSGCTASSPHSTSKAADDVLLCQEGILDVPCTVFDHEKEAPTRPFDLVVTAAGYCPGVLRVNPAPNSGTELTLQLALVPAISRSVRIELVAGQPFRGEARCYAPAGDLLCWDGRGDNGLYGPFDWPGGDLLLNTGNGWDHRILHASLATSEVLSVTLNQSPGSIRITGVPADYPREQIVLRAGLGPFSPESQADSCEQDECVFTGLAPGDYLVGPRPWVSLVETQSVAIDAAAGTERALASRTTVSAGVETLVPWRADWTIGRVIQGRVTLRGPGVLQPVVIPWYCIDGPVPDDVLYSRSLGMKGRLAHRVPLDKDGGYRLESSEPLPACMLIGVLHPTAWGDINGLHLVEITKPGETVDIELGAAELHWKGPPRNAPVHVRYVVPESGFRMPLRNFFSRVDTWWNTSQPLVLNGLPMSVKEVRIDNHSYPILFEAENRVRIAANSPTK